MGMFDTVSFRYRMPDGETEPEYQTKSLDCECAFYEFSAEGRLHCRPFEHARFMPDQG